MSGGGIGIDYSIFRPKGALLRRTGGIASGPIPLMRSINEVGRNVMQGGSRRSAIYASLNWQHGDVENFLHAKDWSEEVKAAKLKDFNSPGDLDMTNISINWDTAWLEGYNETKTPGKLYYDSVKQMCMTAEPGHSYNFYHQEKETLRNACTEVTSEDDSDVCNLGSINMGNIHSKEEFQRIVYLASRFLVCGTLRASLPYDKVYDVRQKNRRLGLGLMGMHEWLLRKGYDYAVTPELHEWLAIYRDESKRSADELCNLLGISKPVAYRAIAPTGTIGIMASTTTGIEPLFAVSYKRRYLTNGTDWKFEYVIDGTAQTIIQELGIANPDDIQTAYSLAKTPEKRIKFQYEVQKYVDMAISSTINLEAWGSEFNNEDTVVDFANTLAKYAHGLRGFTAYPDGSRGGQPLTAVPYYEALAGTGMVFDESDEKCKGRCLPDFNRK